MSCTNGRQLELMVKSRRNIDFRRTATLVAGVALFAVPTVFTVVPGWTRWNGGWRAAILAAWFLIAVAIVFAETVRGEAIQELTADRAALLKYLRLTGMSDVLSALLRGGTRDIPESYEFTLYLFVDNRNELWPYYPKLNPRRDRDPRIFVSGKGATGTAWQDQEVVVVRGDDVSNEAYGLTAVQQEFYKGFRSVASAVVWEENTRPIGVVTALGKVDDGYFAREGGRDSLRMLAQALGVVLNRIPERDDLELEGA